MHATAVLDTYLRDVCQSMHSARWKALTSIVDGLLIDKELSVTGLGRALRGRLSEKHKIKKADRLVGNAHLATEIPLVYQALSRVFVKPGDRPLILVDWSDLTKDRRSANS